MPSPAPAAPPARWKAICAYDGTGFGGWQSQAGGNGIQDVLKKRLAEVLGQPTRIFGSGRTDAGVHARGQVFHFDAAWRHGSAKLIAALRIGLPPALQVRSIRPVRAQFHARIDARAKRYVYHLRLGPADPFERPYVWEVFRPLDFTAMAQAARLLQGRHDFRSFTALNGTERETTVRHLRRLEVRRAGRRVRVVLEAEGFLYKMARSLVGALVSVGEGKLPVADLRAIFEARHRTARILTAPPQGLFLERVFYQ